MLKVMYEGILVGQLISSHSMSLDAALELLDFTEEAFIQAHGFDAVDYNEFYFEWE